MDLVPAEITYGLERLVAFLQNVDSVYDIEWAPGVKYRDVRFGGRTAILGLELRNGGCGPPVASVRRARSRVQELCWRNTKNIPTSSRFPVLPTYDQVLKCSNIFNLLDARGAISVTERVAVIKRVRDLAVGTAKLWAAQQEAA